MLLKRPVTPSLIAIATVCVALVGALMALIASEEVGPAGAQDESIVSRALGGYETATFGRSSRYLTFTNGFGRDNTGFYRYDLETGRTTLVAGAPDGDSRQWEVVTTSADGDTILASRQPSLLPIDAYAIYEAGAGWETVDFGVQDFVPQGELEMSDNGQRLVFSTRVEDLTPDDPAIPDQRGDSDVFVLDRSDNSLVRVSIGPDGEDPDFASFARISSDGAAVGFTASFPGVPGAPYVARLDTFEVTKMGPSGSIQFVEDGGASVIGFDNLDDGRRAIVRQGGPGTDREVIVDICVLQRREFRPSCNESLIIRNISLDLERLTISEGRDSYTYDIDTEELLPIPSLTDEGRLEAASTIAVAADGRAGVDLEQRTSPDQPYLWQITAGTPPPIAAPLISSDAGPDVTPPNAPTQLTAVFEESRAGVQLRWTAASDDVAVTNYRINRLGDPPSEETTRTNRPTFLDRGTIPGRTYTYEVRALDQAGNESAPAKVDISVVDDGQPPAPPVELIAIPANQSNSFSVRFRRAPVGDPDFGQNETFRLEVDGVDLGGEPFSFPYTPDDELHEIVVVAVGQLGRESRSEPIIVPFTDRETVRPDPPSAPTGLQASEVDGKIELTWDQPPASDVVYEYLVFRNFEILPVNDGDALNSFRRERGRFGVAFEPAKLAPFRLDSDVVAGARYRYQVVAFDPQGRASGRSDIVSLVAGNPEADNEAPTSPRITRWGPSDDGTGIKIEWFPARDNVQVTGYLVHRDYQYLGYVPALRSGRFGSDFTDEDPPTDRLVRYQVRAQDAAGNNSEPAERVKTRLGESGRPVNPFAQVPDTGAPNPPQNISGGLTDGGVEISWTAGSDAATWVTGYVVHVDTGPGPRFVGGTYVGHTDDLAFFLPVADGEDPPETIVVRSQDAAGNFSAPQRVFVS